MKFKNLQKINKNKYKNIKKTTEKFDRLIMPVLIKIKRRKK
jgi:hypothetical protein